MKGAYTLAAKLLSLAYPLFGPFGFEQIDDYGHSNQLKPLMEEILDFDRTIGKVFEWATGNGETLVVVTADHETGGLTLVGGSLENGEIAFGG